MYGFSGGDGAVATVRDFCPPWGSCAPPYVRGKCFENVITNSTEFTHASKLMQCGSRKTKKPIPFIAVPRILIRLIAPHVIRKLI